MNKTVVSNNTPSIGEIIEVSSLVFTAQCLEIPRSAEPRFFDPPEFGSFVKIAPPASQSPPAPTPAISEEQDPFADLPSAPPADLRLGPDSFFALVCHARMSSLDPTRKAMAFGLDERELVVHQPQIFELMTTEFSGMLVAFTDSEGCLRRHLPPRPPKMHSRVLPCLPEEVRAITADVAYLRLALAPGPMALVPQDELVAAALRSAWDAHGREEQYLLNAGKKLAALLSDNYERLQAILQSVL